MFFILRDSFCLEIKKRSVIIFRPTNYRSRKRHLINSFCITNSTDRKWRELPFDASFSKIGSHLHKKSVVEFHSLVSVSSEYRSQSVALDTFIPLMKSLCSSIQPFFPVTSVSKATEQRKKEWLNATALNQRIERVNHWFIVYSIIANRFSVIWLKWKMNENWTTFLLKWEPILLMEGSNLNSSFLTVDIKINK